MNIKLPENKKILIFCAHPDDDTFSSGATIYKLVKNGNIVNVYYLTSSPRGVVGNMPDEEKTNIRKREGTNACKILGAKPIFLDLDKPRLRHTKENVETIIDIFKKEQPDIVFLPVKNDIHPTHQKTSKIVLEACKSEKTKELWFYETWTPLVKPNFIFFFEDDLMKIKIKAMKVHKSQIERNDILTASIGFSTFRGIMGQELLGGFGKRFKNKKVYGEAFLVVKKQKMVIKK